MNGVTLFIVLQCVVIVVLQFGDIGFDKPGRFGLDYDDAIKLLVLYGALLVAGLCWAAVTRRWRLLALQLALPLLVVMSNRAIYNWQRREVDPANYQHLVGMSKTEAHDALWGHRHVTSGSTGEYDIEHYNGMVIRYSPWKPGTPKATSYVVAVDDDDPPW
jgi:hypothetical protein